MASSHDDLAARRPAGPDPAPRLVATTSTGQPRSRNHSTTCVEPGQHHGADDHRASGPVRAEPAGHVGADRRRRAGSVTGRLRRAPYAAPFQRRQPRRTSRAMKNSSTSPSDQQQAGDRGGGPRVLDRERDHGRARDVLEEADADVGDRLGRGVDRQPDAGLDQVRQQRGAAADRGEHDLVERLVRGHVAGEQRADHRAGGRPDQRSRSRPRWSRRRGSCRRRTPSRT